MRVINLGEQNSILNRFVSEIRDKNIQKDPLRFRTNIERIGEIFAYEISKTLSYSEKEVVTPLGIAKSSTYDNQIVIASILRAAIPLHMGMLRFFDSAQNAFVAAYRKYKKDNSFEIQFEYASKPDLNGKILILADTMLATGASCALAYKNLREDSEPEYVHIVCPIASKDGIEYLNKNVHHKNTTLWVAAIDEELTNKSYIVPGLGDAGDLAFGSKL